MDFTTSPSSRRRALSFVAPILALMLLALPACSESTTGPASNEGTTDQPITASFASGMPRGLFFMTRYWPATSSLEKSVWYFAADGTVYEGLRHGFSSADLSAHQGPKGTATISGDIVKITYADGSVTESEVERDNTGFFFDGGIFTPITSFTSSSQIVGTYEGGESISYDGNASIVTQSLELKADGTFRWSGVSFVRSGNGYNDFTGGGSSESTGTWKLSGYSLTLTDASGIAVRKIAFPYDDDATPIAGDWTYFGGIMFKRK